MGIIDGFYTPTNIIEELFYKFAVKEQVAFISIIAIIVVINILQTNVVSAITSSMIDAVEHNQYALAFTQYKYFVGISVVYFILYLCNDYFQTHIITQLTPWLRLEFFKYLLRENTENLTHENIINYNSPINRVSYASANLVNNLLNNIVANVSFILIITLYFLYKNTILGGIFLVLNLSIFAYVYINWNYALDYKLIHEKYSNGVESQIIDLFNNFDKIIYRGETENEINRYEEWVANCINHALLLYSNTARKQIVMIVFVYITIFVSTAYLLYSKQQSMIDTKTFITFITILLLYRDKLIGVISTIPSLIEICGRVEFAATKFKEMKVTDNSSALGIQKYKDPTLTFDEIRFEHVSYKYKSNPEYLFQNMDFTINTNKQVVGITGKSGKGKSTIMKLLLRLYNQYEGNIYIDGVNIRDIDPTYIRKNITYVNQNSKLFDKTVIDNMMYGCSNMQDCSKSLEIIMKHPFVTELYKDVDIQSKHAGSLGENLSGGQRQIANILSGLINPSPILILDEPTNALDLTLKKELLEIIDTFRQYKKCIIIITHDRDVYPLFDRHIRI